MDISDDEIPMTPKISKKSTIRYKTVVLESSDSEADSGEKDDKNFNNLNKEDFPSQESQEVISIDYDSDDYFVDDSQKPVNYESQAVEDNMSPHSEGSCQLSDFVIDDELTEEFKRSSPNLFGDEDDELTDIEDESVSSNFKDVTRDYKIKKSPFYERDVNNESGQPQYVRPKQFISKQINLLIQNNENKSIVLKPQVPLDPGEFSISPKKVGHVNIMTDINFETKKESLDQNNIPSTSGLQSSVASTTHNPTDINFETKKESLDQNNISSTSGLQLSVASTTLNPIGRLMKFPLKSCLISAEKEVSDFEEKDSCSAGEGRNYYSNTQDVVDALSSQLPNIKTQKDYSKTIEVQNNFAHLKFNSEVSNIENRQKIINTDRGVTQQINVQSTVSVHDLDTQEGLLLDEICNNRQPMYDFMKSECCTSEREIADLVDSVEESCHPAGEKSKIYCNTQGLMDDLASQKLNTKSERVSSVIPANQIEMKNNFIIEKKMAKENEDVYEVLTQEMYEYSDRNLDDLIYNLDTQNALDDEIRIVSKPVHTFDKADNTIFERKISDFIEVEINVCPAGKNGNHYSNTQDVMNDLVSQKLNIKSDLILANPTEVKNNSAKNLQIEVKKVEDVYDILTQEMNENSEKSSNALIQDLNTQDFLEDEICVISKSVYASNRVEYFNLEKKITNFVDVEEKDAAVDGLVSQKLNAKSKNNPFVVPLYPTKIKSDSANCLQSKEEVVEDENIYEALTQDFNKDIEKNSKHDLDTQNFLNDSICNISRSESDFKKIECRKLEKQIADFVDSVEKNPCPINKSNNFHSNVQDSTNDLISQKLGYKSKDDNLVESTRTVCNLGKNICKSPKQDLNNHNKKKLLSTVHNLETQPVSIGHDFENQDSFGYEICISKLKTKSESNGFFKFSSKATEVQNITASNIGIEEKTDQANEDIYEALTQDVNGCNTESSVPLIHSATTQAYSVGNQSKEVDFTSVDSQEIFGISFESVDYYDDSQRLIIHESQITLDNDETGSPMSAIKLINHDEDQRSRLTDKNSLLEVFERSSPTLFDDEELTDIEDDLATEISQESSHKNCKSSPELQKAVDANVKSRIDVKDERAKELVSKNNNILMQKKKKKGSHLLNVSVVGDISHNLTGGNLQDAPYIGSEISLVPRKSSVTSILQVLETSPLGKKMSSNNAHESRIRSLKSKSITTIDKDSHMFPKAIIIKKSKSYTLSPEKNIALVVEEAQKDCCPVAEENYFNNTQDLTDSLMSQPLNTVDSLKSVTKSNELDVLMKPSLVKKNTKYMPSPERNIALIIGETQKGSSPVYDDNYFDNTQDLAESLMSQPSNTVNSLKSVPKSNELDVFMKPSPIKKYMPSPESNIALIIGETQKGSSPVYDDNYFDNTQDLAESLMSQPSDTVDSLKSVPKSNEFHVFMKPSPAKKIKKYMPSPESSIALIIKEAQRGSSPVYDDNYFDNTQDLAESLMSQPSDTVDSLKSVPKSNEFHVFMKPSPVKKIKKYMPSPESSIALIIEEAQRGSSPVYDDNYFDNTQDLAESLMSQPSDTVDSLKSVPKSNELDVFMKPSPIKKYMPSPESNIALLIEKAQKGSSPVYDNNYFDNTQDLADSLMSQPSNAVDLLKSVPKSNVLDLFVNPSPVKNSKRYTSSPESNVALIVEEAQKDGCPGDFENYFDNTQDLADSLMSQPSNSIDSRKSVSKSHMLDVFTKPNPVDKSKKIVSSLSRNIAQIVGEIQKDACLTEGDNCFSNTQDLAEVLMFQPSVLIESLQIVSKPNKSKLCISSLENNIPNILGDAQKDSYSENYFSNTQDLEDALMSQNQNTNSLEMDVVSINSTVETINSSSNSPLFTRTFLERDKIKDNKKSTNPNENSSLEVTGICLDLENIDEQRNQTANTYSKVKATSQNNILKPNRNRLNTRSSKISIIDDDTINFTGEVFPYVKLVKNNFELVPSANNTSLRRQALYSTTVNRKRQKVSPNDLKKRRGTSVKLDRGTNKMNKSKQSHLNELSGEMESFAAGPISMESTPVPASKKAAPGKTLPLSHKTLDLSAKPVGKSDDGLCERCVPTPERVIGEIVGTSFEDSQKFGNIENYFDCTKDLQNILESQSTDSVKTVGNTVMACLPDTAPFSVSQNMGESFSTSEDDKIFNIFMPDDTQYMDNLIDNQNICCHVKIKKEFSDSDSDKESHQKSPTIVAIRKVPKKKYRKKISKSAAAIAALFTQTVADIPLPAEPVITTVAASPLSVVATVPSPAVAVAPVKTSGRPKKKLLDIFKSPPAADAVISPLAMVVSPVRTSGRVVKKKRLSIESPSPSPSFSLHTAQTKARGRKSKKRDSDTKQTKITSVASSDFPSVSLQVGPSTTVAKQQKSESKTVSSTPTPKLGSHLVIPQTETSDIRVSKKRQSETKIKNNMPTPLPDSLTVALQAGSSKRILNGQKSDASIVHSAPTLPPGSSTATFQAEVSGKVAKHQTLLIKPIERTAMPPDSRPVTFQSGTTEKKLKRKQLKAKSINITPTSPLDSSSVILQTGTSGKKLKRLQYETKPINSTSSTPLDSTSLFVLQAGTSELKLKLHRLKIKPISSTLTPPLDSSTVVLQAGNTGKKLKRRQLKTKPINSMPTLPPDSSSVVLETWTTCKKVKLQQLETNPINSMPTTPLDSSLVVFKAGTLRKKLKRQRLKTKPINSTPTPPENSSVVLQAGSSCKKLKPRQLVTKPINSMPTLPLDSSSVVVQTGSSSKKLKPRQLETKPINSMPTLPLDSSSVVVQTGSSSKKLKPRQLETKPINSMPTLPLDSSSVVVQTGSSSKKLKPRQLETKPINSMPTLPLDSSSVVVQTGSSSKKLKPRQLETKPINSMPTLPLDSSSVVVQTGSSSKNLKPRQLETKPINSMPTLPPDSSSVVLETWTTCKKVKLQQLETNPINSMPTTPLDSSLVVFKAGTLRKKLKRQRLKTKPINSTPTPPENSSVVVQTGSSSKNLKPRQLETKPINSMPTLPLDSSSVVVQTGSSSKKLKPRQLETKAINSMPTLPLDSSSVVVQTGSSSKNLKPRQLETKPINSMPTLPPDSSSVVLETWTTCKKVKLQQLETNPINSMPTTPLDSSLVVFKAGTLRKKLKRQRLKTKPINSTPTPPENSSVVVQTGSSSKNLKPRQLETKPINSMPTLPLDSSSVVVQTGSSSKKLKPRQLETKAINSMPTLSLDSSSVVVQIGSSSKKLKPRQLETKPINSMPTLPLDSSSVVVQTGSSSKKLKPRQLETKPIYSTPTPLVDSSPAGSSGKKLIRRQLKTKPINSMPTPPVDSSPVVLQTGTSGIKQKPQQLETTSINNSPTSPLDSPSVVLKAGTLGNKLKRRRLKTKPISSKPTPPLDSSSSDILQAGTTRKRVKRRRLETPSLDSSPLYTCPSRKWRRLEIKPIISSPTLLLDSPSSSDVLQAETLAKKLKCCQSETKPIYSTSISPLDSPSVIPQVRTSAKNPKLLQLETKPIYSTPTPPVDSSPVVLQAGSSGKKLIRRQLKTKPINSMPTPPVDSSPVVLQTGTSGIKQKPQQLETTSINNSPTSPLDSPSVVLKAGTLGNKLKRRRLKTKPISSKPTPPLDSSSSDILQAGTTRKRVKRRRLETPSLDSSPLYTWPSRKWQRSETPSLDSSPLYTCPSRKWQRSETSSLDSSSSYTYQTRKWRRLEIKPIISSPTLLLDSPSSSDVLQAETLAKKLKCCQSETKPIYSTSTSPLDSPSVIPQVRTSGRILKQQQFKIKSTNDMPLPPLDSSSMVVQAETSGRILKQQQLDSKQIRRTSTPSSDNRSVTPQPGAWNKTSNNQKSETNTETLQVVAKAESPPSPNSSSLGGFSGLSSHSGNLLDTTNNCQETTDDEKIPPCDTRIPLSDMPSGLKEFRVMTVTLTNIYDVSIEEMIIKLGGKITTRGKVLVAGILTRTNKVLVALATGTPIVGVDWVLRSFKAGFFLDPWEHVIDDPITEQTLGITLKQSLKAIHKFLTGWVVYITPKTSPPVDELKYLIELCGGTVIVVRKLVKVTPTIGKKFFSVSSPKDRSLWNYLPEPLVSEQAVVNAIVKQKLYLENFGLKLTTNHLTKDAGLLGEKIIKTN